MKKFYLFTQRGITGRFFCGAIYEALPTDKIRMHGEILTFQDCVNFEFCKVFESETEANEYSESEYNAMDESDSYAQKAMDCENAYGCEGVDDMRYEF